VAIAYRVCSRIAVLSAVNRDDDKFFAADDIADVIAYRFLAHKLMPIDLTLANTIPENCLCVRLIDA